MTTKQGSELTLRKIETRWHPYGAEATVTISVNGQTIKNTQLGTSEHHATINAKFGALNWANARNL